MPHIKESKRKVPFRHRKMKPGFRPVMAFRKGNVPWNKDKSRSDIRDENNVNWKGDYAGYYAIHDWVRVRLGTPQKCDICGTTEDRMYHWATKSGIYSRDLSDWLRLCVPCHRRHDGSAKKAWVTRRKNANRRTP